MRSCAAAEQPSDTPPPSLLCSCAVYDVTRRETLSSLSGSWMEELQSYDPHPEVARMVVANKVDQVIPHPGGEHI